MDSDETSETREPVEVDEGFRRWYRACPCCLGEAYPQIKEALRAERAQQRS